VFIACKVLGHRRKAVIVTEDLQSGVGLMFAKSSQATHMYRAELLSFEVG